MSKVEPLKTAEPTLAAEDRTRDSNLSDPLVKDDGSATSDGGTTKQGGKNTSAVTKEDKVRPRLILGNDATPNPGPSPNTPPSGPQDDKKGSADPTSADGGGGNGDGPDLAIADKASPNLTADAPQDTKSLGADSGGQTKKTAVETGSAQVVQGGTADNKDGVSNAQGGELTSLGAERRTPQLGIESVQLTEPTVPESTAQHIEQETGRPVADHFRAVEQQLAEAVSLAGTLQAMAVSTAMAMGTKVHGWLDQSKSQLVSDVSSAKASVSTAYGEARKSVDTSAEKARAALEAGKKTGSAQIEAAADRNSKKADKLYTDQAKAYTDLHAEMLKPFSDAFAQQAATVRADGASIAAGYDKKSSEVNGLFASSNAMDRYLNKIRIKFVKNKIPEAKTAMTSGAEQRAVQLEGQTQAMSRTITEFLAPLAEQLKALGQQGKAAVATAKASATKKLQDDVQTGLQEINTAQADAKEQLTKDEQAALTEIDTVDQRNQEELTGRKDGILGLFETTSADFSEDFKGYMQQSTDAFPKAGPVTEEASTGFFESIRNGLYTLFGNHSTAADQVAQDAQAHYDEGVSRSRDGLKRLVASATTEAKTLADTKSKVIEDVGTGLQGSLGTLSQAIDASLNKWSEPITTQLAEHIGKVRTKLSARLTDTKSTLKAEHGTWKRSQEGVLAKFLPNLESPATVASRPAQEKVEGRAKSAYQAMRGLGTDENKLFNALRGMSPGEPDALRHAFRGIAKGSLGTWLADDLNQEEMEIASAHLELRHGAAARLEISYSVNWYGDDEAQIEAVLRGLPEEERAKIAKSDDWAATRTLLRDNLDGPDLDVAEALIANNVPKADAIRLKEKIDIARRKGKKDDLHDALAGMDQTQIDQVAMEFAQLEGVGDITPADADTAKQMMSEYVTRDIKGKKSLASEDKDLADALIVKGNDSVEAKVARFEVEMQRPGGPKQERLEKALLADGDLKERLHSNDPETRKKAQAELETQQQQFQEQYTAKYGREAGDAIKGLQNQDGDTRDLYKTMLDDGYNTPELAKKQIKLAVKGAGTREDEIKRALGGMSPADIKELKKIYPDLEKDLGVNAHTSVGGELSGQDRMDVEILLMGDPKHMNDDERFELAQKKYDQQRGSESTSVSRALFGGTTEAQMLEENWDALKDFRNSNKSKFKDGKFAGTPQEYEDYRTLCRRVGINAELYQEQVDRVADGVTTGIAIAGAVAGTVLSGGTAGPILAAAVAGLGSAGTNAALKGGRYGWEQGVTDLAATSINMVTAGQGAKLAEAAKSASKPLLQQTAIASGKSFVESASNTALQDATWKNGVGEGLKEVGYQGVKSAAVGGVTKGVEEKIGATKLLEKGLKTTNKVQRGISKATQNTVSGMAGKTTELTIDSSTGRFKGDLDKWAIEIGKDGGKNAVQGFLEGAAEGHRERLEQLRTPSNNDTDNNTTTPDEGERIGSKHQQKTDEIDAKKARIQNEAEQLDKGGAQKTTTDEEGRTVVVEDGGDEKRTEKAVKLADETEALVKQQEVLNEEVVKTTPPVEEAPVKPVVPEPVPTKADTDKAVKEKLKQLTPKIEEDAPKNIVVESEDTQGDGTLKGDATDESQLNLTINDDEIAKLQRRVQEGQDQQDAVLDIMSANQTDVEPGLPKANQVLDDDAMLSKLVDLEDLGSLERNDVDRVLEGRNAQDRHERLKQIQAEKRQTNENREGYPQQLLDVEAAEGNSQKAKLVQEAIESFETSGQGDAVKALQRLSGSLDEQAALAHHLAVYRSVITKSTTDITEAELTSLIRAHHALVQDNNANGEPLRKFISDQAKAQMLSMKGRDGEARDNLLLGGCVGDGKNTQGLTAEEAIHALGLDYNWKDDANQLQISPFIESDGQGGHQAKKEAYFLEIPVTSEVAAKAKITVKSDLYQRIATRADGGDPYAAELMTKIKPKDPSDPSNALDPYTGTGGTAAGELLGKGKGLVLNQEMEIGGPAAMPHGTKMYKLNDKGQNVLVGTYLVDGSGSGSWAMADS